MKAAIGCLVGLVFGISASAEPLLEGRVRLESGQPVADAQVQLFDLTNLRQGAIARAMTDGTGYFALPLAAPTGRALPARFALGPNYPNPFNPSTIIPYQLAASSQVRLEVFNLLGQRIATLVDEERAAGFHTATWHATDGSGRAVAAGVYIYRMTVGEERQTGRMVLIDGQAGIPAAGAAGPMPMQASALERVEADAGIYGLTVAGEGLVAYVNPAFRVGVDEVDIVVEEHSGIPRMKLAAGGILGDVDNNERVDFFDALLVALYSGDSSIVMPNNGDISSGDVNADGRVDLTDAWLIAAYLNDPSDSTLPSGIGEPVGETTTTASQTWKLYWTDFRTDKIQRSNLDGSGVEDLVTTGLDYPSGLALDVSGGKLYWTDAGTDKIQRSNLDGSGVEDLVTTGLVGPGGLALDVSGGKLYWGDGLAAKIQRSNLDGSGVEDLVTTGLEGPFGLALDVSGGKLYWTDTGTAKIQRSNLDGSGVEDLITTGLEGPRGLALDVSGGKLYWTDTGTAKIQRSNLDGSGVEDLVTTGLETPSVLALDVSGGKLYWGDWDKIQRSNLDGSGVEDLVTTGLGKPSGLALGLVPVEAVAPLDEQTFNSQMVGKSFHAETFFLDFVSAGRFSENGRLPGSYSYSNTGSNTGLLTLTYDGGQFGGGCTLQLTFASATTGTLSYTCDSGDDGQETWRISEIGTPLAPRVVPRSGTELGIRFIAFFEAGETRAYDFRWRTKIPQGSWVGGCDEFTNTESRAFNGTISSGIGNLEPGTVYEVQYRYRNSSRCGEGTPGPWSEIGEGATSGGGGEGNAGGACFVGQELSPGQSCTFGSNTFRVTSEGRGCVGGICAGTGLHLNDFSATKSGDTWTIVSLP